jgi:hypothetical protein
MTNHITGIDQSCPQWVEGESRLHAKPAKNKGAGARVSMKYIVRMKIFISEMGLYA